jgi:hypothetical protein
MPSASGSIHGCRRREQRETVVLTAITAATAGLRRRPPGTSLHPPPHPCPRVATQPETINDRGEILGAFTEPASPGKVHGSLLSRGRHRTFDAPGGPVTFPQDVNDRGQVVCFSFDPATTSVRSFLLAKGVKGPFTPVNFPGAPMTLVAGLNDRVQLVGSYQNTRAMADPQSTGMPLGRTS